MPEKRILLVLPGNSGSLIERLVLLPAGYQVALASSRQAAEEQLRTNPPDILITGDPIGGGSCFELAKAALEQDAALPVILLPERHSDSLPLQALRAGFCDYLRPPAKADEVLQIVERALERRERWQKWSLQQVRSNTSSLEQRLQGLEAMQRIGHEVTSLLDLDAVLTAVVSAAVDLTHAEEGSLLLLDENSGELYMRASRNINDELAKTFRLPIRDTLAGQVLRSGQPLLINESSPQKIKTAYLVNTLIYVPLSVQERVIGVLGVDNRLNNRTFSEYHVAMVSALADYAAIAIENARLYSNTETERKKLETILTRIEDGVLVIDPDGRIMLVNRTVCDAFNLSSEMLVGKRYYEILQHPDLLDLLSEEKRHAPHRMEISLEDGRVFNAQLTPIPDIGLAITMQDITHLKELDRIKTDFVNTVSHDLRSPLTAILGYVELIDRVGPVNDMQSQFIQRVQFSVNNITTLINDLLDLGRIEAGFDVRKEVVPINTLIHYAIDSVRPRMQEKNQTLVLDVSPDLPHVLGNPVRLRQMVNNLVSNASKYTPNNGNIEVLASAEGGQIILQIVDNGPGIPGTDQPYIFDKFYRASNIPSDTPGTGLGLAIVKSIVENHQGRIWVESTVGHGTTFTVVLPVADREL